MTGTEAVLETVHSDTGHTLVIDWLHVEQAGQTCDRCASTGQALREVLPELRQTLAERGLRLLFRETVLPEEEVETSNRVLVDGVPLEDLLGDAEVVTTTCASCAKLLDLADVLCRAIEWEGERYEALDAALVQAAVERAADGPTARFLQGPLTKPADTDAPVHPLVAERWSPRSFAAQPVELDELRSLLEAARWAPSSFNEQPWRFIVGADGDEAHRRISSVLFDGNATWASRAPVLVLSLAKTTFDHNGAPNAHAWHDVGLSVAALTTQATALGLAVHQMGGFDADAAREAFQVPEDFEPVAALAIGYPGDPDELPEELAEHERAPRERLPVGELVHGAPWGQASALADGGAR